MATDLAALKTALETDTRYDAAVRSGKNSILLILLKEEEAGQTVFRAVTSEDVLDAIGDGVRGLTGVQLEMLRLYTSREFVDFRKTAIRAELREIFSGNASALTRLKTVESQVRSYGEGFGGIVSFRDLWKVLPGISKSYMAKYKARR